MITTQDTDSPTELDTAAWSNVLKIFSLVNQYHYNPGRCPSSRGPSALIFTLH